VVLVSPAFLVFALQYTNRGQWVTPRFVALLAIEPVLFNIAVWTDSYHGLVAAGWQGRGYGDFVGGIVFWMHSFYSYALLAPAYILLINGFLRAPPIYRRQSGHDHHRRIRASFRQYLDDLPFVAAARRRSDAVRPGDQLGCDIDRALSAWLARSGPDRARRSGGAHA